ncbi:hypothetical protein GCM10008956_11110 [Deinococcus arenae]|uniref:Uncharacterized protein n=1 Tax=Deinococcus arenae TaxID=1452751 RepID=A0A8H9GKS1_9DEIO|nr:hypothetical protein GCM10008956_11110 [Deinococcus arenae]
MCDAALIAAAQRVEHCEIAGYGTVVTYARLLGHGDATTLLDITLHEEGDTDEMACRATSTWRPCSARALTAHSGGGWATLPGGLPP